MCQRIVSVPGREVLERAVRKCFPDQDASEAMISVFRPGFLTLAGKQISVGGLVSVITEDIHRERQNVAAAMLYLPEDQGLGWLSSILISILGDQGTAETAAQEVLDLLTSLVLHDERMSRRLEATT